MICFVFSFSSLLMNGGWINLYSMRRDRTELKSQLVRLQGAVAKLDGQLKRAKDPAFIERRAMDQLDMASDHDLVFVFSE